MIHQQRAIVNVVRHVQHQHRADPTRQQAVQTQQTEHRHKKQACARNPTRHHYRQAGTSPTRTVVECSSSTMSTRQPHGSTHALASPHHNPHLTSRVVSDLCRLAGRSGVTQTDVSSTSIITENTHNGKTRVYRNSPVQLCRTRVTTNRNSTHTVRCSHRHRPRTHIISALRSILFAFDVIISSRIHSIKSFMRRITSFFECRMFCLFCVSLFEYFFCFVINLFYFKVYGLNSTVKSRMTTVVCHVNGFICCLKRFLTHTMVYLSIQLLIITRFRSTRTRAWSTRIT